MSRLKRGCMVAAKSLGVYKKSNFAPGFLFLSAERRRALQAIYAFCRVVDDIVDLDYPDVHDAEKAKALLDQWRFVLRNPDSDVPQEVDAALWAWLQEAIRCFSVDTKHLLDLIDGVQRDLVVKRYASFEELKAYCYGVASTVGLACLPVFGLAKEKHFQFAVHLGLAVQMTNILRDIKTDAQQGRVYVPQEDLKRFGYGEDDLMACRVNENFMRLMNFEIDRAKGLYALAVQYLPSESRALARPALLMGKLYRTLLRNIEKNKRCFFNGRQKLSSWEKAGCVFNVYFLGGNLL